MYVVTKETGDYSSFTYEIIGVFTREDCAKRCCELLEYERDLRSADEEDIRIQHHPPKDVEFLNDDALIRKKDETRIVCEREKEDQRRRMEDFARVREEEMKREENEKQRAIEEKYKDMRSRFQEGDILGEIRHYLHHDLPIAKQYESKEDSSWLSFVHAYGNEVIKPLIRLHGSKLTDEDFRAMLETRTTV